MDAGPGSTVHKILPGPPLCGLQHYVTHSTLWFGCYWQQFYVVHVQVLLGACTMLCDEQERPLVNKIDEKKMR